MTVTAAACTQVSNSIPSPLWCSRPLHDISDTQVSYELIYDCPIPQINRSFVSLNMLECVVCVYVCESFYSIVQRLPFTVSSYISNLRSTWKCTPIHSKAHLETTYMYKDKKDHIYIYIHRSVYSYSRGAWLDSSQLAVHFGWCAPCKN